MSIYIFQCFLILLQVSMKYCSCLNKVIGLFVIGATCIHFDTFFFFEDTLRHICVHLIRHAIDWQPIHVAQHFETTFDSSYKAAGVLALKILSVLVPIIIATIIHHDMSDILKLFNPVCTF